MNGTGFESYRTKKRRERDARLAAEQAEAAAEFHRRDSLSMYDRIEESDASEDVKDILHRLARHVGLED